MPRLQSLFSGRPLRQQWGLALACFGAALGLRLLAWPVDGRLALATFYPAAALALYLLRPGPGWAMVGLSAVAGHLLATWPHGSSGPWQLRSALAVGGFLATAALISLAVARHRGALQALEATRSALAAREAEVADKAAFLQKLTDHLPVRLAYCDTEGRYRFVNQAHCARFGLPRAQVLGRTRAELTEGPDDAVVQQHLQQVRAGQVQRFEFDDRSGGQLRRIASVLVPDTDAQGRVVGFFSTGMDVTERVAAQRALADSEALLARTGAVAGIGGWQLDVATGHVTWTAQTRAIHEVAGNFDPNLGDALRFHPPQTQAEVARAFQQAIDTGRGWDLELPLTTATGREIWVRAICEVECAGPADGGRVVRLFGTFQDISARRALQAELQAVAARATDLYDNAPCAYYSLDAQGVFVRANTLLLAWLGCSREQVVGRLRPTDFFTDEGRQAFGRLFPAFLADGRFGPMEFELCGRDVPRRWVSVSATAVRDADGRFVKSRSVMYDVSALHEARAALRQLSATQAAMLDNDLVGMVRLRDRTAVWKNRALERMFGHGHDELIGRSARLLYADDASYEAVGAAAYPVLAAGQQYRHQLQMRRRDGTLIWVDLSGFMLAPETGESLWMMSDITPLKQQQAHTEQLAFHDSLTGLPNRLLLADRMRQAMALDARLQRRLLVCLLDLDGFKAVNDRFGHDAGDTVLRTVARRLTENVRASDTVARLGGDEFVLLLTPLDSADEGRATVQRVIDAVAQPVDLGDGRTARVSASIGVAQYPEHGRQPALLLEHADAAMYQAKRQGKNQASGFAALGG